jgi:hypothetical protein
MTYSKREDIPEEMRKCCMLYLTAVHAGILAGRGSRQSSLDALNALGGGFDEIEAYERLCKAEGVPIP